MDFKECGELKFKSNTKGYEKVCDTYVNTLCLSRSTNHFITINTIHNKYESQCMIGKRIRKFSEAFQYNCKS